MPVAQYQETDGTLVTDIGGRVRGRHAREAGPNGSEGVYAEFGPNYFERRTHRMTIYDDVSPTNPAERVLTIVIRPQWWWYAVNFRHSFVGADLSNAQDPERLALYADNGGVKMLPGGSVTQTPLRNYDQLPTPPSDNFAVSLSRFPGADYAFVKQITRAEMDRRPLRAGDVVEFELGIFLAREGVELGRGAYYSDAIAYKAGTLGAQPWFKASDNAVRPWDSVPLPDAARQGGALTLSEDTSAEPTKMLMQAATNIAGYNMQHFVEGRRLFHTSFFDGSHSETGNPVLSQQVGRASNVFSAARCTSCHAANGKSVPSFNTPLSTMAALVGERDANGRTVPHPLFGTHIQQGSRASGGQAAEAVAEGSARITSYTPVQGRYPDGTAYTLQTPVFALRDAAGAPVPMPAFASLRVAPHIAGMGLIEAISESTLQGFADPDDRNGDGVRGRLSIVDDLSTPNVKRVGRFGWRAEKASLDDQVVAALNFDMGVRTAQLPNLDCGRQPQGACRDPQQRPLLAKQEIDLLVKYVALLGVPAPTQFDNGRIDPAPVEAVKRRVLDGARLFSNAQCVACHLPSMQTGNTHRFPELRNQRISPYSNFLLHDMGPELADTAGNSMYRTSPLWGLGKLAKINPETRYLHDGRARTLEEAILWHGGEANRSKEAFMRLPADDRRKVIEFLQSL
jgi:CxxC motif-containing protein (DUF1111 family)